MLKMQTGRVVQSIRQFSTTQSRPTIKNHLSKVDLELIRKRPRKNNNLTPKDAMRVKFGGSSEIAMKVGMPLHMRVQPTGYYSSKTFQYVMKPEMIPEFIVPDLEGFELKPYVDYSVKEIKQSKLTARDIYNEVYASQVDKDIREGKYKHLQESVSKDTKPKKHKKT